MQQEPNKRFFTDTVALSNTLRRLEVDNISWMTALMYTILFGPGETAAMVKRLERNADEMAGLFAYFFGREAGDRVRDNMEEYLENFVPLVEAYRDDDIPEIERRRNALYDLADELAAIFAGISPDWDKATIQTLVYEMIRRNEEEIVRIKTRDYVRSIEAHDELQDLMYRIADEVAYGIIRRLNA